MTQSQDVVIARIVKARGIRGEVACDIETDFLDRFERDRVTVTMPDGARLDLRIEDHWFHKGRVILKFEGYDTMNAALTLVGGRLVIAETDGRPLEEGEFYEHQLIGSEVVTREGHSVGRVTRIMRAGLSNLLVVEGERELLIPFVDEICAEVDTEARRIIIDAPDGLLDL
ncbi:MAG: ribosome maturation factor RimM [Acidobacteriota bacterium]